MPAGRDRDPPLVHVQRDAGAGARPGGAAAAARHADRRHRSRSCAGCRRRRSRRERHAPDPESCRFAPRTLPTICGGASRRCTSIHGDEPLLALEAGDAIRAAARAAGATEREVFVVEAGFRWDAFLAANLNRGLFGDRKLRRPAHPVGQARRRRRQGARSATRPIPNPDNVTLVTLPRLDRADASVGVVRGARRRRRHRRRVSGRARRAAGVDRGAHEAPSPARVARRRSRFSPTIARAICSPRGRRSRSWRCCCRKASSRTTRSRRPSPTSRATTSSSCPKPGWPATRRACCAS